MKHREHWYRIYIGECPICGKSRGPKRERVYGKKPSRPEDRYVYLSEAETYDYCDVW